MQNENLPASGENIPVRRGKVSSVIIYEVREDELRLIEQGGAAADKLNFAIGLISSAVTALITVLSTDIKSEYTKFFFVALILIGFILGIYFWVSWNRNKKSVPEVVSEIRKRLNGSIEQESEPDDPENEPN